MCTALANVDKNKTNGIRSWLKSFMGVLYQMTLLEVMKRENVLVNTFSLYGSYPSRITRLQAGTSNLGRCSLIRWASSSG
jgi:hypothetical protein